MSGRQSSSTGARTERAMVRRLLGHGLPARKVSAMSVGSEAFDFRRALDVAHHNAQVFAALVCLDGRDPLIVKADRPEPLATEIAKGTA